MTYPPEVGLRAEDSILEQLATYARETLAKLKTDGAIGKDVELQVVTGNGWDEAIDAADWQEGDLLAVGTSPVGGIARVFLGSRASKILRHSPVPVLVLPD
jgi:nucleotide-binding universal stress UspA family protein